MPPTAMYYLSLGVYVLLAGYLIVWGLLLRGCLRRSEFYPLFTDSRLTRKFWLATFIFLNPLLNLLYLIFARPRPTNAPLRESTRKLVIAGVSVVIVLGFFVNLPGVTHLWMEPFIGRSSRTATSFGPQPQDHPALELTAGIIEARSQRSSTCALMASGRCRFSGRRIAVICESDHPLVHQIAHALRKQLAGLPEVQTVEVYTNSNFPTAGTPKPDLFIRLNAENIHAIPIPYAHSLNATILAAAGRDPWRSTSSCHDSQSVPLLEFDLQTTIEHQSTTRGYESPKYKLAGENIAKELAEQLAGNFKQWREKYGMLPELPAFLYGTYRPTQLPNALEKLHPDMLCSYDGILRHNDSMGRLTKEGKPVDILKRVADEMTRDGWRESGSMLADAERPLLRMAKDSRTVEVFRFAPFNQSFRVITKADGAAKPQTFYIHYEDAFSTPETEAALDKLYASNASIDTLLAFQPMYSSSQCQRLRTLLGQHRKSLPAQLALAEMLADTDKEQARAAFRRAANLCWISGSELGPLKEIAKRLGEPVPDLSAPPPTDKDMKDMGVIELTTTTQPIQIETGVDELVSFFRKQPDGTVKAFCMTVLRAQNAERSYLTKFVQRARGSRSESIGGMSRCQYQGREVWQADFTGHLIKDAFVRFQVTSSPAKDRFIITVQLHP